MVVKVTVKGLKIARNPRGRYYVYLRATGEAILRNFEGDREALEKRLGEPDLLGLWNARRPRADRTYPEKTLGWLVAWFMDPERPEWKELSPSTQDEYRARFSWLETEFDAPLDTITTASLYETRDTCAAKKWPAYADKMMTALSSMFNAAVARKIIPSNPAVGIKSVYKPNKNANREWRPAEFEAVMRLAPISLRTPYMIARYLGYRSQSIVAVCWSDYQDDPAYGKCFRFTHDKNDEAHWLPAAPELQAYLASLKVRLAEGPIAIRRNGEPWESAEQLQKQSSNFLKRLERKGIVGKGLTEHGLRATFAASIKREAFERDDRATDEEVAAALGDRDPRMGAHYSRHVENEIKVIQAFGKTPKQGK